MTKLESLDCLAVKRRAQRSLARALASKSPDEQAKIVRRLAAQAPLWKEFGKRRPGAAAEDRAHTGQAALDRVRAGERK